MGVIVGHNIFFINVAVAVKARKELKRSPVIEFSTDNNENTIQVHTEKRKEMKLIRCFFIMFATFFIGFYFYGLRSFLFLGYDKLLGVDEEEILLIGEIAKVFFGLSSIINPILTLSQKDFKIKRWSI